MDSSKIVKTPDTVWWNYVSGPSLLVRETVSALCSGKNVCLCMPHLLPWRDTFLQHVADATREVEEGLVFEEVYDLAEKPGRYLVNRFGLDTVYRPTKPYANFLRERRALADRVICVKATTDDAMRRWFEFEKEYKTSSVRDGLVLLETQVALPGSVPKHVQILVYDDFVSEYDTFVFAGLLLPDNKMDIEQKRYLATMAVSLLSTDVEGVVNFVKTFRFDHDDPEQFSAGIHSHNDLLRRVWNAQVQTLFPLIMRECKEFIDRWREKVDDAFDYASMAFPYGLLDTNRVQIESPDEMELATIRYLMHNKRRDSYNNCTEEYILYIPDESARSRIELLYGMRNRIAHGEVCPVGEVVQLLNSAR